MHQNAPLTPPRLTAMQGSVGWGWGWGLFCLGHHHCFNPFFLSDISRRDIQAEVSVTNPASQSSRSYFFHLLHRDFNPCPPEPTNAKCSPWKFPSTRVALGFHSSHQESTRGFSSATTMQPRARVVHWPLGTSYGHTGKAAVSG